MTDTASAPQTTPVDYDPFAAPVTAGPKLTPVDDDPFASKPTGSFLSRVGDRAMADFNSLGRGVATGGEEAGKYLIALPAMGAGVIADKLQSLATGTDHTEASDWAAKTLVQPFDQSLDYMAGQQAQDNKKAPEGAIINAAGKMIPQLATMVATEGGSELPTLATDGGTFMENASNMIGNALTKSTAASALPAEQSGVSTGEKVYDETGDAGKAIAAGVTDAATTVVGNALPMGLDGKVAKRLAAGAVAGAAGGEVQREGVNAALPTDMQSKFSWADVGTNALFGAALGGAFHEAPHEDPQQVTLQYNDLQKRASDGDPVAQKATAIVGDLSAVDGMSGSALNSAQLGAKAASVVDVQPHDELMTSSDRYRQIYQSALPTVGPDGAADYARTAYASEVATNVAWDAYLQDKNVGNQRAGQAKIAADIRSMVDVASKQVDPVEMSKLTRWATAQQRMPLDVRNALYETITNNKVPDAIEAEHGEHFHPDGSLTEKALQADQHPAMLTATYKDSPQVAGVLKAMRVVPYRMDDGRLSVHGDPELVDHVIQTVAHHTGEVPTTGETHGHVETEVHPADQGGRQGTTEGPEGGNAADRGRDAETGQPDQAVGREGAEDQGVARSFPEVGKVIDQHLADLDTRATKARPIKQLAKLGREADELETLIKGEQAKRESGVVRSPENSLSDSELQTAKDSLSDINGQLAEHRDAMRARATATQVRDKLAKTDTDEGLRQLAESIKPSSPVTPRNKAVLDGLDGLGIAAKVNPRGRIDIPHDSADADALLDAAARDTNAEVTPAQAASGNYRKGRSIFRSPKGDIPVHIETMDGAVRRGEGWSRPIKGAHYGYIPGTRGADGDPLDVFTLRGAHDDTRPVAVISQHNPSTGAFDELKVVMGASNKAEALTAYHRQYPPSMHKGLLPNGKAHVVMMDRAKFKRFLDANAADVPPHPVSGMPMLHLRRPESDRLSVSGDTHEAQSQGLPAAESQGLPGQGRVRGGAGRVSPSRGSRVRPVEGLPATVKVDGEKVTFGPNPDAVKAAADYSQSSGLPYDRLKHYAKVDEGRAKQIADAYEAMKHDPQNPEVKASYDAMIKETVAQWEAIKKTGLKVDFIKPGQSDPYASNPRKAIMDVNENNHLWVFPTDAGFGSDSRVDVSDNPLLAHTGEVIDGHPLRANDVFRIVHDYFGHVKEGFGFRADGEENAWRSHATMYSPLARRAMTSETRGQNSWVNYGPHAEANRTASGLDTHYADQKIGLMPDWVSEDGRASITPRAYTPDTSTVGGRLEAITGVKAGSDGVIHDRAAFDKAVAEYNAIPETMGGKVMGTDIARELSPDYLKNRTLSPDTHDAASSFIKALYLDKLNSPHNGESYVAFTAGGTGAGKTTALESSKSLHDASVVYDTNLNGYKSSLLKIEQALASGRKVKIMYVYRDPVDAMVHGALKRAERQAAEHGSGRTVPIDAHVDTHVGSLKTLRQLEEHFKGDDRFSIEAYDNSFGVGKSRPTSIEELKDLHYDDVRKNVEASIEEAYDHGQISKETYKGFLGRHPQARVRSEDRASERGEERGTGSDRSGSGQADGRGVPEGTERGRPEEPADAVSQFSWEAVPSTSVPGNDWIHAANSEFKMAYTKAINASIGPKILDEFGIAHSGVTVGFGGWKGEVNPSVQEHFSPAEQRQLANAAATYGLLLKQDGVVYHTPEYGNKPSEENGVHVEVGRPLTEAETAALYQRVTALAQERFGLSEGDAQNFAPAPNARGVRFLNFNEDVPNKAFHKLVTDAASDILPMDTTAHTFKSVGDMITNDWSTDPHGKMYVQRLVEAGGWDSARRTIDRLGPEVDKIDAQFRERAAQGEGGQGAADQADRARAAEAVRTSEAHHAQISDHIATVAKTLKQGDRVHVLRDVKDMPEGDPVRRYLERLYGTLGDMGSERIPGVYYNGHTYLFSHAITDRANAESVMMHEVVGHAGIRAVFGKDLTGFLDGIHDSIKDTPLYRELATNYGEAYPKATNQQLRRIVGDEYMANLAQTGDHRNIWQQFVGWARQWARSKGMALKWTDNDLRTLLGKVATDMREGRLSTAHLSSPQTTFGDISTSTYDGAAGRGELSYHADGSRTLRIGDTFQADLHSRSVDDRQILQATNLTYGTPAELLHLTRFAGEEGKDGVVLAKDQVNRATVEASGIPFRETPAAFELTASTVDEGPNYSLRNRTKGSPEVEAILKKALAHSEYEMTPWDRMQKTMRDFRDAVQQGDAATSLKQSYVDALAPIANYEKHMSGGQLLDAAESAYKMSWMAKNNEQITAGVMKLGVPEYQNGTFAVVPGRKGLMDIFKPLFHGAGGKPLDALWEGYAMARRSAELIKQTNPDGTSREKLLSQDDIDKLIDLEKQYPQFKTVLDEYQEFNNHLLDLAVERGALSPDMAELWKQNTYVPFYRALEETKNESNDWRTTKGISGKRVTSQRLYGSDKMAEPIIESIIKNSGAILDRVYANEAMRRVVTVANGIGMERMKMPFSPVSLSLGEIEKTLGKINYFAGTKKPGGGYINHIPQAEMDKLVTFFKMSKPVGPDIVSVMEGGKPVYYKVTDPSLYRAITAFNDIGSFDRVLGAILGVPKKVLTLGVTLDPRFMYRNLFRDMITSWAQSGTNPNMLKDMGKNAKEVYSDGAFINALRVAGYNGNEYFKVNELRRHLDEMHGSKWTVLNSPKKLFQAYHKIGFVSEQMNRIRVAKHVLDQGGSMAEAAWQAQNTLNFQMRGDSRAMQLLIRAVPFLNARIQGLNRLYDGALGRDVTGDRKRAVMSFAMKSAAIMAGSMALALKNESDPRYQRIPEAAKDLYYHFFVGDHHFVLPKPFELGSLLGTLPERAYRTMVGKDTAHTFVESMQRMVASVFQFDPTPQAVAPYIEDWANKDSLSGHPIINQTEQGLLPAAQYSPRTSPTMIKLAHAMPKFAPDALRSPDRLAHLYRGYTATLGGYALMMADAAQRAAGTSPAAPSSRYGNVAIGALEGTFGLGNPDTDPRNKYTQQLYDAQDEADRAAKTLNTYLKSGHIEEAREVLGNEKTALSYRATIHSVTKEMGALRKAEAFIYASPTMTPEEKRTKLDRITATRTRLLDGMGPMLDMVTDYH